MTALWIVLVVVGYLAHGIVAARFINKRCHMTVEQSALYVVTWPITIATNIIGRLAGGKP